METPDGAAAILNGIDARRRIVHFPWQLSYPTKYVLGNLPGFIYDRLASKLAPSRKKKQSVEGAARLTKKP
jgi:hypothetical protein